MKGRFVLLGLVMSGAATLASCAGGGLGPGSQSPGAQPARASATLQLTIPASRTPSYLSPSAMSIKIVSYAVSGGLVQGGIFATTKADLTAPACTTGTPRVCTITVVAPTGQATFGISLYDQISAGGNVLATVSPNAALAATISSDVANTIPPLVLNGVPASITVAASGTLRGGVPTSIPVTVTARDAQNNVIFGDAPYANPITLTSSPASGAITFPSVTSPTTAVTLNFNGNSPDATSKAVTIGASASGVPAANVTTPMPLAFQPATLALCSSGCSGLANGPSPYALSVSEAGYGGSVTATIAGTGCNLDATTATVNGGSGSLLVYGNPSGGTCTVTATDGYGQTASANPAFAAAGLPTVISASPSVTPADPNGGFLYVYTAGTAVKYGSYTAVPYQSNTNPVTFELATFANLTKPRVKQQTISGNRYITSVSVAAASPSPLINYVGQSGTSPVAASSLYP